MISGVLMNKQEKKYCILAYYFLRTIEDPKREVLTHKKFFENRDVTSRIYISEQGINGQMSAVQQDAYDYIEWMHSRPEFQDIQFKIDDYHEQVFPRKTVKYRKQLVALDEEVDLSNTGEHVTPEKWQEMLTSEEKSILLDVRNDYEWKIGHFEGAELPQCENFREFKSYAKKLKQEVDIQKTPVMMYCTGGIRCELYSAILKKEGFENVYQLDGGVINYGKKLGNQHWLGKLFVFDDRLAVPLSEEQGTVIGECHHCGKKNDNYYNCANMDCNRLFLCCPMCAEENFGCCEKDCQEAPRLRPYQKDTVHKPFRKKHNFVKDIINSSSCE
jgi:UPF0176 protein